MLWKLKWSSEAAKDISKIEQKDARRIMKKLEFCADDPSKSFERLVGYDDYKLRIGDYRVICLLSHENKTILVEKIGHRKNIYRKL